MASNSIHRITVNVEDYQELDLTGPAVSVAADREYRSDRFDLWYEHYDPDLAGNSHALAGVGQPRALYVFGTGHPVPWTAWTRHAWHFLGTVVTPSGLVWHVYDGPLKGQAITV